MEQIKKQVNRGIFDYETNDYTKENEKKNKRQEDNENLEIKENKGGRRYSISRDSQGRELTQQQVEFFSDSKVRDDNGNLQAYYNGSDYFYEYDKTKISDESKCGKGIYLTKYKDVKNANIDNEYISDFVGELLFINEEFIRKLSTNNSLFNQMYTRIKYLVKALKTGSEEKNNY